MGARIQHALLRGVRCKFCRKKFHPQNINRFIFHLNRHQRRIKPYWYTNPYLPPKAGCVKFDRQRSKCRHQIMQKGKASLENNQDQENIKEITVKKEITVTSEHISQIQQDYKDIPEKQIKCGQKSQAENSSMERNIWKAIKIDNFGINDYVHNWSNTGMINQNPPVPKICTTDSQTEQLICPNKIKVEKVDQNENVPHDLINNIKQDITAQNLQKPQTRASRRLRNRGNLVTNENLDMNYLSDTELEMIDKANFQKAVENSMNETQMQSVCDICVTSCSCTGLVSHEGIKVCKGCLQMMTSISQYEDNNTGIADKIEIIEIADPTQEGSMAKIEVKVERDDIIKQNREENAERKKVIVHTDKSDSDPAKPYKCSQCDKRFLHRSSKNRHQKMHDQDGGMEDVKVEGDDKIRQEREENVEREPVIMRTDQSDSDPDKPYKCSQCDKRFLHRSSKNRHQKMHDQDGSMEDVKVEGDDKIRQEREENVEREPVIMRTRKCDLDPNKPFKCSLCPKRFLRMTSKNRHEKIHEAKYRHKCSYCDKTFYRTDVKKYHEMEHTGVRPFQCQFCDKKFKWEVSWKGHEKIHTNDRPHKCTFCDKRFIAIRDMERHQVIHTGDKPFTCQYCAKSFSFENSKNIHEMIHTGVKPFKCHFCDKMFSRKGYRKTHEMMHTDERPVKCEFCEKTFRNKMCKESHERTHTGETPFKCKYCDKKFTHRNTRTAHERFHTGEKPYKCSYCTKCFRQYSDVKSHEKVHTGIKPYECSFCPKKFSQTCAKVTHERRHTGEKPFQCHHCSSAFTTSGGLKDHERIHTGEKPFKCSFCIKTFRKRSHKVSHEQTHTGERPFKCFHCQKTFRTSSIRRKHLLIHTGDKPHKCSFCGKAFRLASDLKAHETIHTGDRPYKCRVCLKGFRDPGNMRKHERAVHEHEKLHKCSYCPQTFSDTTGKQSHERIHTGERPFNCSFCRKTFRHSNSLKLHERLHTGEKPYQCTVCFKAFTENANMKKHVQAVHEHIRPHTCSYCSKTFRDKRNKEKHERIHTVAAV